MVNLFLENIELRVDDEVRVIEKLEDIQEAIQFFQQLLNWYMSVTASIPKFTLSDNTHGEENATATVYENMKPENTVDYVLLALNQLGRPSRFPELLHPALELGWPTAADTGKRRIRLLEVAARRNPLLTNVKHGIVRPTRRGNERITILGQTPTIEGVESDVQAHVSKPKKRGHTRSGQAWPSDAEVVNMGRQLFQNWQYNPTTAELASDLEKEGWVTTAKNKRDRIYHIFSKYPEFQLVSGHWHHANQTHTTLLNVSDSEEDDNLGFPLLDEIEAASHV